MDFRKPVLFASFILACGTAEAEDKWYATAKFGWNLLDDQTIDYSGPEGSASGEAEFDGGFAAGGALGYEFGNDWRLEGEVLYRTVDLDTVAVTDVGEFREGDYSSVAIALNALYDFNLFGDDKVRSYAGAGVAWLQEIDIDFEEGGAEQSFSGDDVGFQVMFGARYDLGENWFIDAEVRYFYVSDVDMEGEENAVGMVTADYDPVTLGLSVGWRF